ncbi:hypothetical protein [Paracoccus kondratievae]|uniref:hypothetical protein n=1 Tax=Paracoccus kondratievae TaxID=135740 RepID=UPI0022F24D02|nr:hypothetical protein [Paracoccus kondratievae]
MAAPLLEGNPQAVRTVRAFEAAPMDYVRKLFDTNTFGTMAMVQAVIPQMRARRAWSSTSPPA